MGSVDTNVLAELEALENAGWASLCNATGHDFYRALMTDDGVMVLANGAAMNRDEVAASLRDAPPWASYRIDDLQAVDLGTGVALVYTGTARREDGGEFVALMTSSYVRNDGAWRLALYTQTPVPG